MPAPTNSFSATLPHMADSYCDERPTCTLRWPATDHGVVLKHGDGPGQCDILGAREAIVYLEDGKYHLFYDGSGPRGWLACVAVSDDLLNWKKLGPIFDFGAPGMPDSATAASPWMIHDGECWHAYYVASPNATPGPDFVPFFPYLALVATAPKLTGPWTKRYDIRPYEPKPGTWYSSTASPGYIIRHDGEYLQFFSASTEPTPRVIKRTLGIARTRDLKGPWTIDPEPLFSPEEQVENSSLYYEPANGLWFLFTNHIGVEPAPGEPCEYTDAIWVYWSDDPTRWDVRKKAVVVDGQTSGWAKRCIGMPSVLPVGNRLAILYDAPAGTSNSHMRRDIGLAWLPLPLMPPKV